MRAQVGMQTKLKIIQRGCERVRLEVMSQAWDGSVVTGPLGRVVMFVS
jgi:hypothetical protein